MATANPYSQSLLVSFTRKLGLRASGTSSVVGSTVANPVDDQKTSDTGWVKRWFTDKSFGFIKHMDGGEDVYIHWKQLVGTKVLRLGDTVSYNTEYDKSKEMYKAIKCAVTSSEAESKGMVYMPKRATLGSFWVPLGGKFFFFFQSLTSMFG